MKTINAINVMFAHKQGKQKLWETVDEILNDYPLALNIQTLRLSTASIGYVKGDGFRDDVNVFIPVTINDTFEIIEP